MKLETLVREHCRKVLLKHGGNVAATVRELGVSRQTFYTWATKWGWLKDGTLCRKTTAEEKREYERERRKAIAGCGQPPVKHYGDLDQSFYERIASPAERESGAMRYSFRD